ncbi:P-loop containing nucleoside triphosphate hydrolase protein [Pleurotus eryngii]|uniref:DNA 3'-5' helicase n=1 Tax=Pleurotus eryngii TaxID=5323 RepID=A0A9P5ZGI4_PLEER|nr:P-loop containing nucleoside triphosphate hydrolase protein [Pleurotus eryngii]
MDKTYFSVDGHPIPFTKFKEYAIGLISSAESKLDTVLRGWQFDDIDKKIKTALQIGDHQNTYLDRLHDMGVGYSFFSDPRNHLKNERNLLLKHFLREGYDEFATSVPGAVPSEIFKPGRVLSSFYEVDSLVSTLYAATVTTWPGAGRGSELDHLTYRNDHGKRHIFFINNILTFVTSYIKTQQITGRAPLIPRGVDPRLARVFIVTINFVYYAASVISAQLKQHEQAIAYTRYVFVYHGVPMNAERMTRVLREHTLPVFHIEFGIRDWRHVMKFVLRHKADIALEPEDEEEQNKDPLNSLFGHTGRIGDHVYAIESSALESISAVDVTRAQKYGVGYQRYLGLWPDLANTDVVNDEEHKEIATVSVSNSRDPAELLERVLDRLLPVVGDQLTSMVARALYNELPHHTPPYLPSSSAVNVHPSRLDVVKRLYGSDSFQSPQQAAMFEYILQNTYTVVGILPTGGGKSLMFYGPSLVEKDGVTIVISPFVALADEQFETAQQLGIPVSRWPSSAADLSSTRLLIVPAHAAGTNDFVRFVRASAELGLIRRIIFDEAHQIILSAQYRDCYDSLPLLTRTGVQVHFLSATLLQCSIDEIIRISCIPVDAVYVIRAPTFRPNICYDAQHFSNTSDESAYDQMMNRVEELCTEHVDRLDEDGRMLIYCSSYKECDGVFERTRYPIHRAKGSTGDDDEDDAKKRQAVAHDWRAGRPKVLIATTGFGNGIDYAHVRVVISVNARNGSDAVQQTGQAGRDGQQAHAYILGSMPLLTSAIPDPDFAGVGIMNMLHARSDCIRICLGEFDNESYSCISHGRNQAVLCTRCKGLSVSSIDFDVYMFSDTHIVQQACFPNTCPTRASQLSNPLG